MNREKQLRAALADGTELYYVAAGPEDGRSVLLLHVWGESCGSFERLMPMLPATVRAMAADVLGYMDVVGLESALLLGSSNGSYVAQQVAVTTPDRVAGLVLVGSPLSFQGRPDFADEVDRRVDPVDPDWVSLSLDWFPWLTPVPSWYLEERVHDGARIPAHVWIATLNGLTIASPPPIPGPFSARRLSCKAGRMGSFPRRSRTGLLPQSPARDAWSTRTPATWSSGNSRGASPRILRHSWKPLSRSRQVVQCQPTQNARPKISVGRFRSNFSSVRTCLPRRQPRVFPRRSRPSLRLEPKHRRASPKARRQDPHRNRP